jgi:nucleotide-binding universal stress UspA family protein
MPDAATQTALKNILLATDFSPCSQAALMSALSVARRYNSKIYLAHVVRSELIGSDRRALEDAWRDAQSHITDLFIAGHLQGINHEALVAQGDIWNELSRMIREHSIDLVVVGTRGRTGLGKLLLGSVAERIFRQAPCPVLTVGPRVNPDSISHTGPERILYPTGFAAHSLYAVTYAISLAQEHDAQLYMLHVVKELPPDAAGDKARVVQSISERLQKLVPADAQLTRPPQILVEFGSPAQCILELAENKSADLLVLGVHQPTGFDRLRWAIAYELVSRSPCPVLTVRTPDR